MRQKTQKHFFKFSIHLSVRKSRENYRQIYGKSKESLRKNFHRYAPQLFLGQSFALQLQFTIYILFRTTVLRKLFDIRFSYKHSNFSRVCLLVKMDSKTVTRSILEGDRRRRGCFPLFLFLFQVTTLVWLVALRASVEIDVVREIKY